jgi:cold shock CspA family protein
MKESGYQPIYVRYEEIVEKKKKQLEENQKNKQK